MAYKKSNPNGQAVMASSEPVVIASDQSAIPVDSELAAAAALADNTANPTVTSLGTFNHWYDGATWDRAVGNSADGLLVNLGANNDVTVTGITATEYVEDAALPANPTGGLMMGRQRSSLSSEGAADGDALTANLTESGAVWVKHHGVVDVTGSTVAIAAASSAFPKTEDSASFTGDVGVPAMAVRKATPANLSDTDADYEMLQMSAGRLWTSATIDAALPTGSNVIGAVTQSGTWNIGTLTTITNAVTVAQSTASSLKNEPNGQVAHDVADSGNPIKVGARAVSTLATATMVAAADRTDNVSDIDGVQITRMNFPLGDLKSDAISNTDGASTASSVFTAVASTRNYITGIHVFRTDSGTTPIYIDFRDGTGGAVLWRMVMPPNGGSLLPMGAPVFRTSANTALAYDVSAATTTVYINVSGFQSKA